MKVERHNGQAILEGAIVLALIVGATLASLLFMINLGLSIYRHQQVAFVANMIAQASVRKFTWMGVPRLGASSAAINPAAAQLANQLLNKLGLPPASAVNVVYAGNILTATVRVDNPVTFGSGGFIPTRTRIEEVGVAAIPRDFPPAVCEIDDGAGTLPGRYSIILPCYRAQGASAGNPAVAGGPPTTSYQYGFWLNQAFYTPGVYPNSIRF